ncbi:hypothetical protein POKO110462_20970 [Pontibacter korlensis]|uniref:hypothetical protein n=1 Tax=Pontibacter korlensis TaxID=400092 RepID=UPI000AF0FC79|nr:hypothetical protein [Pontibacter korlensis]
MADLAVIISTLSILGLFVGIPFPKLGLFWYHGKRCRLNVLRVYLMMLVLSFLVFAVTEKS